MKSCISEREFNRFFEDAMTDEEIVNLESHIKECGICHAEYVKWKALKQIIEDSGTVQVPDTLKSKIMQGVRKERILDLRQPIGAKKTAAVIGLIMLIGAYYLLPSFDWILAPIIQETAAFFSEVLYGIISLMGLDIKSVAAVFKASIPVISQLFWFFAGSTMLLILGFFSMLLKGRVRVKEN